MRNSSVIIEGLHSNPIQEASISVKQRKAAELAIKNLIFKMDECEIASNQFSYAHLSNDKMAELMSEVDPKYEYEVEVHTEPSKRFGKITHHIMMRVKK